jgi:hypothetical protein
MTEKKNYCDDDGKCTCDWYSECKYSSRQVPCIWYDGRKTQKCTNKQARADAMEEE